MAMNRAYIDYAKFQQLTERGVIYVTKMKKNLKYNILSDSMYQTSEGLMEVRMQNVEFVKQVKGGGTVRHKSRIITYADIKKHKLISLLTNDMDSDPKGIIADEAELPPEILLWGECKCNQNPEMGNSYRKSAADGDSQKGLTRK